MSEGLFICEHVSATAEESEALITLRGINLQVRNNVSTTSYKVLDGKGSFKIINESGIQYIPVGPDDEVIVPAGSVYQDMSEPGETLKMLATSRPPFNPVDVHVIK